MEIEGAIDGRSGAVTVVQRSSADLKLNAHLHSVLLDGVFVAGPEGSEAKPVFRTLPSISDTAVAGLLQIIRARLMRLLVRRRVVEADGDTLLLADDLEERDSALAQLAAAAHSARQQTGTRLPRGAKSVPMAVDGQWFPSGSARSAAPSGIDRQLPPTPGTPRGRLFQLRTGLTFHVSALGAIEEPHIHLPGDLN
jgi:hypothetical protein